MVRTIDRRSGSARRKTGGWPIRFSGLVPALACIASFVCTEDAIAQTAADSTGIWQRSNLLGDMGGLRPWLGRYGITFSLQETSEVLGNFTGGIHQGSTYDGLTQMSLGLDTQKAFGWAGGTFNVSALQIHGNSISADNLLSLDTASGNEADRATRLWELWYQQTFLHGSADVKVGLQSLDQEFMLSQYAGLFINSTMGWPEAPSADMIAGGPQYPLSALGLRLRVKPTSNMTVLAGVFDDNPAGPGAQPVGNIDPQVLNPSGTKFRLNDNPLFIAELQYAINQPSPDAKQGNHATGLPGTYKLGMWYDTGSFADQEFDSSGLSLANPASNGNPLLRSGDYGIYAVMDQMIWRPDPASPQNLGFFVAAAASPQEERNLIDIGFVTGLALADPLPGRDNDTVGVAFGYTKVSSGARALDRDTAFFTGEPYPVRNAEEFMELTYQFQVAPWWQLQADFQYTFNPGGGIPNPLDPGERIGDEAVWGLRTTFTF
jgi:porin